MYFVLNPTFPLHTGPNCLGIPSSHRREGLPSGYLWSHGYFSTTARIHLSGNLGKCPAPPILSFLVLRDHALYSTLHLNYFASDVVMQRYSQHGSFHRSLYCNQSFYFVIAYVCLPITPQAKRCY